jgi:hypothetical protein
MRPERDPEGEEQGWAMADSTMHPADRPPPEPQATPGRWDGTSPGCLAAMVLVLVVIVGFVGFVAWNAFFIGGYMSDDPALHQDWSWTSSIVIPPLPSVGTPLPTPAGNIVSVHGIQNPVPLETPSFPPPSGGVARVFAAADVEVCATETAMTGVSQSLFVFRSPGLGPDRKVASLMEPAFPTTPVDLPLGSCARGWITFAADEGGGPLLIQYADGQTIMSWETVLSG